MTTNSRRLVILGATGTVGVQALQLLDESPDLRVVAVSAHSNRAKLQQQAALFPGCQQFATSDLNERDSLLDWLQNGDYDICLNAVVGAAGLPYSVAVLESGRDLALANKESLVLAGELLGELSKAKGGAILPVDSEHSAIHQCLRGENPKSVRNLFLTASGGALRDLAAAEFENVTPAQALAHPNWNMGPRITIDSATMMNKSLEIIEACHLFNVPAEQIKVLVHRQSVVHSMVEFQDGSMLAQLGPPDMTYPIQYALHHPERPQSKLQGFDPQLFAKLTFEEPDTDRFPALTLGWQAAEMGGAAGAVLNASDEIAVEAFLAEQISFLEITQLCATALKSMPELPSATLAEILEADAWARDFTKQAIKAKSLPASGMANS